MRKRKHKAPTTENIIGNFAGKPVRVIIIVVVLILIIFPLYWLVTSSLKIEGEYLSNPPVIVPSQLTAESYQNIFGKDQIWQNFMNTVIVAGGSTLISVVFGSMAAYAVARGSIGNRARKYFGLWFMVQKMYPAIATAIPVYLVMRSLHLIDTKTALIIMNTSFNLPLVIWLMMGFFEQLPLGIGRIGDVGWMRIYKTVFPDHFSAYQTRNHRIGNFSVRRCLERIFVCSNLKYQQIQDTSGRYRRIYYRPGAGMGTDGGNRGDHTCSGFDSCVGASEKFCTGTCNGRSERIGKEHEKKNIMLGRFQYMGV